MRQERTHRAEIPAEKPRLVEHDARVIPAGQEIQMLRFLPPRHVAVGDDGFLSRVGGDGQRVFKKADRPLRDVARAACQRLVFASVPCPGQHDEQPEQQRAEENGLPGRVMRMWFSASLFVMCIVFLLFSLQPCFVALIKGSLLRENVRNLRFNLKAVVQRIVNQKISRKQDEPEADKGHENR